MLLSVFPAVLSCFGPVRHAPKEIMSHTADELAQPAEHPAYFRGEQKNAGAVADGKCRMTGAYDPADRSNTKERRGIAAIDLAENGSRRVR